MNDTPEQWREIPGYPGYEVSDRGQVRTLKFKKVRLLGQWPTPYGHFRVNLCTNRKVTTVHVHRLMMWAFVGPQAKGIEVRHLDGNPGNNTLPNLAYGTHSDNMQDKVRHGNHPFAKRTHCKWGHEYTPENTVIDDRGVGYHVRLCLECQARYRADMYVARRARYVSKKKTA